MKIKAIYPGTFDPITAGHEDLVKRASNILNSDINLKDSDYIGSADPALFKNNFEKELYKKIHDIRKDFTNINLENDYEGQLSLLASALPSKPFISGYLGFHRLSFALPSIEKSHFTSIKQGRQERVNSGWARNEN